MYDIIYESKAFANSSHFWIRDIGDRYRENKILMVFYTVEPRSLFYACGAQRLNFRKSVTIYLPQIIVSHGNID